jgi:hypothetical protein
LSANKSPVDLNRTSKNLKEIVSTALEGGQNREEPTLERNANSVSCFFEVWAFLCSVI